MGKVVAPRHAHVECHIAEVQFVIDQLPSSSLAQFLRVLVAEPCSRDRPEHCKGVMRRGDCFHTRTYRHSFPPPRRTSLASASRTSRAASAGSRNRCFTSRSAADLTAAT